MCAPCEAGYYGDAPGLTRCTPCGAGKYQSSLAATTQASCTPCLAGYYCPSDATARPIPCDVDVYCPPGAKQQLPCPLLYSAPQLSEVVIYCFFFFALFLAHNKKIIYACSKQNPQTPISTALFSERGVLRGRWRRRCARRRSAAGAGRARRASTRQHRTSLAAAEQGRRRPYIPGIMMISMMKQKQKTKTNSITGATTMKIMLSRAM